MMAQEWSSDSEDEVEYKDMKPEKKLQRLIECDREDNDGFVEFMRKALRIHRIVKLREEYDDSGYDEYIYDPDDDDDYFEPPSSSQLLVMCCRNGAVKCAKALLEGHIGIDMKVDLQQSGVFPLHLAAQSFSADLIELFLQYGAQADLRCNDDSLEFNGLLPLNVAVESLSHHIRWTPKLSVFKLVVELFQQNLKLAMDTISRLAEKTPEVEQIIYHYAEEGKLVELAVLLKAARLKIMPKCSGFKYESENGCTVDGRMALRRCIAIEIASIIDDEYRLMDNRSCKVAHMCKEKKSAMESVMLLLEIFQRLGRCIEFSSHRNHSLYDRFQEPSRKIADLLMNLDFPLTDEDTYYFEEKRCSYDSNQNLKGDVLRVNLCLPSYLQSHSLFSRKRHNRSLLSTLLEIKMGQKMDLDILNDKGSSLLHGAASSLSAGLLELFLRHEADIRYNAVDLENHGLLLLHTAIERISSDKNLIQWTPRQSIFKLIIILCLPKMKEALETVRLLALNTKEIKEVIRYYAKEGGLIELAILLIVAKEKVIDPIAFPSEDDDSPKICMTFRECIKRELGALIDYEYRLMGKEEEKMLMIQRCKEWKEVMMSTLLLLEIFERAGADIREYFLLNRTNTPNEQIAQELASLLAEVGVILSSNDTDLSDTVDGCPTEPALQSCDRVHALEGKTVEPTEHGSQEQDIHTPPRSQPSNISNNNPKHGMPNAHWWLIRAPLQRESSVLSSALQPFHASWTAKASFCSGFPIAVKVEVKERIRGKDVYVRKFSSSKRLATFALVAKRGIRCL